MIFGKGGQITAAQYYNLSTEKLDELGLQMIDYNSDDDLKSGDILVSKSHVEIYSGDGKVFSCGDNPPMKELESNKTISPGNSKIIRIDDEDDENDIET